MGILLDIDGTSTSVIDALNLIRENAKAAREKAEKAKGRHASEAMAVIQAANAVIESTNSPIGIGVGGEFNAGKSLLIGSLVGKLDALPVGAVATTGNATYIYFRQGDGDTAIQSYSIHYLDFDDINRCLSLGLAEAMNTPGLPPDSGKQLGVLIERLKNDGDSTAVWRDISDWSSRAFCDIPATNLGTRQLIREIHLLAATSSQYPALLQSNPFDVDVDTATDALVLPDGTAQEALRLKTDFYQLNPPDRRPVLNSNLIRDSFPLIRRIDIHLKLSPKIWDISKLNAGCSLLLVDLPGLGVGHSKFRDRYICSRELSEVHTVLLLLDSQRPGAAAQGDLLSMMHNGRNIEREHVLVGIGRFDLLPVDTKHLQELIANLDRAGKPLTDALILGHVPALQRAVQGANHIIQNETDRLAFLSPVVWKQRGNNIAGEAMELWRRIARRLRKDDPESALAPILEAYGADGGIHRLREKLCDHVLAYGFQFRLEHAKQLFPLLSEAECILDEEIAREPSPQQAERQKWKDALAKLEKFYEAQASTYRTTPPRLQIIESGKKRPLQEVLIEEVTARIFRWDIWHQFLLNVNERTGLVEIPYGKKTKRLWATFETEERPSLPSNTDQLFEGFRIILKGILDNVPKRVQQAVNAWIMELQQTLPSGLQQTLQPHINELNEIPHQGLNFIEVALNPKNFLTPFDQAFWELMTPEEFGKKAFPLPHQPESSGLRHFGWAENFRDNERAPSRHQIEVLRLRCELVKRATQEIGYLVDEIQEKVIHELQSQFSDLASYLKRHRENQL